MLWETGFREQTLTDQPARAPALRHRLARRGVRDSVSTPICKWIRRYTLSLFRPTRCCNRRRQIRCSAQWIRLLALRHGWA